MKYLDTDFIYLIKKDNPKAPRSLSRIRYNFYIDGMTCGEYRQALKVLGPKEANKANEDLEWDVRHRHIHISQYKV